MTVIAKETLEEMDQALTQIGDDKNAKGLILFSHKKDCFLAGMDVSVIQSLSSAIEAAEGCDRGQSVFNKIEDLKGTKAAISRYGSGSHLMAYVNAKNNDWNF